MTEFVGGLTRLRRRFPQLRAAPLAGGQEGRRHARRAVAARPTAPRCRTRTGIFRRAASSPMCWPRPRTAASRCSSCSTPPRTASSSRCRNWQNVATLDRACSTPRPIRPWPRKRPKPPGAKLIASPGFDPGLRGQAMIEASPFGPLITPDGVIFRLWAPGAQARRACCIGETHADARARTTAGSSSTMPGARPGDALPIPHRRRDRRARSGVALPARGRARAERGDRSGLRLADARLDGPAVARMRVPRTACRHVHGARHVSRRDRQARPCRRGRLHRHRADAGRRFLRPLELGLRRRAALRARQRLWPAGRPQGADRRRACSAA